VVRSDEARLAGQAGAAAALAGLAAVAGALGTAVGAGALVVEVAEVVEGMTVEAVAADVVVLATDAARDPEAEAEHPAPVRTRLATAATEAAFLLSMSDR
jgi:hypothetical protein